MPLNQDQAISVEQEILIVVASVGLAVCLSTALFIFVTKYVHKVWSCCATCLKHSHKDIETQAHIKYAPVPESKRTLSSRTRKVSSISMESIEKHRYASFRIPGKISIQTTQPASSDCLSTSSAASGGSTVESAQDESCLSRNLDSNANSAFIDEYVQPSNKRQTRLRFGSTDVRRFASSEELASSEDLQPELYRIWRRSTAHDIQLGKVRFALQYEDKTRRNLIVHLKSVESLQYAKADILGVYVSMILLPERDYKYVSKQLLQNATLSFDQKFVISSRPNNRDFESRTILMTIVCVEKSAREVNYGECRMPLLSREIYSQVPTEVSMGISPLMSHNEVGDAQVVISYSTQSQKLTVMVSTVTFPSANVLENMNAVHVKALVTRYGGERLGKKRSVSQPISSGMTVVTFSDQMTFKLESDELLLSTLKLNVHGRYRFMRKHTQIGKIRIGETSRDSCGQVHWKTALTSADVGWTMWHPIEAG